MGEDDEWRVLQFQPWQSAPDVAFWQQLATLKLHTFQLKDEPQVRRLSCQCSERRLGPLRSYQSLPAGFDGILRAWTRSVGACTLHS